MSADRAARSRPGAGSFLVSVAAHAAVLVFIVGVTVAPARPVEYQVFEVELVSAPGRAELDEPVPEEELVVETPDPEPPAEETPPPVAEEREEPPREPERRPEPSPREPEPEPEREQPGGASEDARAETGEDLDVRIEGLRRDYPQYYENIIRQINRCFRWRSGGRHRTEIRFVIRSDGTVSDLAVVRPSGNVEFDYQAMGAVECAGRPGRIGPLPSGYPWDRLPITFEFEPPR